jgi:hypothetical protein
MIRASAHARFLIFQIAVNEIARGPTAVGSRPTMYKHLMIATDGSPASVKALAQRLALPKALAAQVTVVTVTEP